MLRTLDDIPGFTGDDGAQIRELVGRGTALASHSVALIRHPAGTAARAHHHTVADEVYVVQAGQGRITIDGVTHALAAGDIVTIRPGQTHKVTAITDLTLLVTCAPAYEVSEVAWDE